MEDNEDDIYLAPEVVDSNSGAAKSVISFLDWLTSSQSTMPDFDHVLVTDDTSYVALDKVISRLHKPISTDSNGNYFLLTNLKLMYQQFSRP